jgi:hypothetical protein
VAQLLLTLKGAAVLPIFWSDVTEPKPQVGAPMPDQVFGPGKEPIDMPLVPASHSAPRREVVSSAAIVHDTPLPKAAVNAVTLRPYDAVFAPPPTYLLA